MMRLGDVATYINGFAFKPDDWSEEGLPIIRIQDLTGNSYQMNRYAGDYNPKYEVNRGDVLISWSASLGVYVWQGEKALLNQHIFKVIFDKCDVDKSFYVHQVAAILEKAASQAHGATMKHLTKPVFDALPFYLPDLLTQQRIADTLDKVSEGIEVCRRMLGELDLMVKAKFGEMFGDMLLNSKHWSECTLESLADIVSGITKGRKTKDENLIEVPYMAVSNVKDGHIDWRTVKTIMATTQEINQYRLQSDDVLMTEGGDPDKVGRGAIIKNPPENCIHQNHIFRVRLNEKVILPTFFAEYLQHQKAKRYFLGCAKQTTGIASINMRQLKAMPVLLPPIELQEQFATFVSKTDKSRLTIQQVLSKMEMVKLALMQEYFK